MMFGVYRQRRTVVGMEKHGKKLSIYGVLKVKVKVKLC